MEGPGGADTSLLQRRSSLPPRLHATLTRRIQRHSSLRKTPVASSSSIRLNKSNPYVGSFRHAPPTIVSRNKNSVTSRPMSLLETYRMNARGSLFLASSSLHKLKSSPYIGWFRHSPPSRLDMCHEHHFEEELSLVLETVKQSASQWTLSKKSNIWVSGHLRGGAPEFRPFRTHHNLYDSSTSGRSGTSQILSRVASWVLSTLSPDGDDCEKYKHDTDMTELFPNLYPPLKTIKEQDDSGDDQDSGESSVGTNDDDDYTEDDVDISISSMAEAYYTHHATKALDDTTHTNVEDGGHRLDYVITQMDIARMARNASRHLDVASILSLPTITYRSDGHDESRDQLEDNDEDEKQQGAEWSWMIVPPNPLPASTDGKHALNDESHVCVICLEQFVDGDRLRLLPCNHSFHVGCIDRWLSGSHSFDDCYTSGCPTCKKRPEIRGPPASQSDGSVPSWAFARIGDALAKDSVTSE